MSLDTKWEFRKPKIGDIRGQPHMSVQIWKDGKYEGYAEIHTHKVKDESVSVGVTVRAPTRMRP